MLSPGFDHPSRRIAPKAAIALAALALMLTACSPGGSSAPASQAAGSQAVAGGACPLGTDPDAAIAKLSSTVLSTGPFGAIRRDG